MELFIELLIETSAESLSRKKPLENDERRSQFRSPEQVYVGGINEVKFRPAMAGSSHFSEVSHI